MTVYDNPDLPEGINDSPDHPWRDGFFYGGAVIICLMVTFIGVFLFGSLLGHFVPYHLEQRIIVEFDPDALNPATDPTSQCLQGIADMITATMPKASRYPVIIQYRDDAIVNAYATTGGRISIHRGLIEKLNREDAVAAVIAHEIGHVVHRDVIALNFGQFLAQLTGALVTFSNTGFTQKIVGLLDRVIALYNTRTAETQADLFALSAIQRLYGHGEGMIRLFNLMATLPDAPRGTEFWNTHPDTLHRLAQVEEKARSEDWLLSGTAPNFKLKDCHSGTLGNFLDLKK